jgi:hypothetical protein
VPWWDGRAERGRRFGQVARPLLDGNVLLLSASIEDQLATVRVIKRRLLYANGVGCDRGDPRRRRPPSA